MKLLIFLLGLFIQNIFCAYPGGLKSYNYTVTIPNSNYVTFDYSIDANFIKFSIAAQLAVNVFVLNTTELGKFLSVPQIPYQPIFNENNVTTAASEYNVTVGDEYWTLLIQNPSITSSTIVNVTHIFVTVIDIDWSLTYGLTISIPIMIVFAILLCVLINAIYLFISSFFQNKEEDL